MTRKRSLPEPLVEFDQLAGFLNPEAENESEFKSPLLKKLASIYQFFDPSQTRTYSTLCQFNLRNSNRCRNRWNCMAFEQDYRRDYSQKQKACVEINRRFMRKEFAWGYTIKNHQMVTSITVGADYLAHHESKTFWPTLIPDELRHFIHQEYLQELLLRGINPIFYGSGFRSVYMTIPFGIPIPRDEALNLIRPLQSVLKTDVVNNDIRYKLRTYDDNLNNGVRLPLCQHQDTKELSMMGGLDLPESIRFLMEYEIPSINLYTTLKDMGWVETGACISPYGSRGPLYLRDERKLDRLTQRDQVKSIPPYGSTGLLSPSRNQSGFIQDDVSSHISSDCDAETDQTRLKDWFVSHDAPDLIRYLNGIPQGEFNLVLTEKQGQFLLGFMAVYGSKETAFDALSGLACIGITDRNWQKDRLSRLEYYKKKYFKKWEDCEGVYLKPDQDTYRLELKELETRLTIHLEDRRAVNTAMTVATYCLSQLTLGHYALAAKTVRRKLGLSRGSVSKYMILLRTTFPVMQVTEDHSPPWKGQRARRYALNQTYLEGLRSQKLAGTKRDHIQHERSLPGARRKKERHSDNLHA